VSGKNAPDPTTSGDYVPFRIDTSKPPIEAERLALFYIDDVEYTGPVRVSGATALKALQWVAERGTQYAAYHTMVECIGQEAYDALTECPQLTFEQTRDLVSKISNLYFGQAMEALGE
jgi:hypothetical protein